MTALGTETYSSFTSEFPNGVSDREALDRLTTLTQMETPFYDAISRGMAGSTRVDYWEDDLGPARNVQKPYGFNFTGNDDFDASIVPELHTTYVGDFVETGRVTTAQNKTKKVAGPSSTYKQQVQYKTMRLKYNIEATILDTVTTAESGAGTKGSSSVAAEITSAWNLVNDSDVVNGAAVDLNIMADGALLEANVFDNVRTIDNNLYKTGGMSYNEGNGNVKDANMILMSGDNQGVFNNSISERADTRGFRQDIGNGKSYNVNIQMVRMDKGVYSVMPDPYAPEDRALICNPQNFAWLVFQPTEKMDLPKNGKNYPFMISHMGTLIHRAHSASGKITHVPA